MTVLRSRKIPDKPPPKRSDIQPFTPARTQEPRVQCSPAVDGSVPVAYQCDADESLKELSEKEVSISVGSKRRSNDEERYLSLRSGKRVAKRGVVSDGVERETKLDFESSELGKSGTDTANEDKGKTNRTTNGKVGEEKVENHISYHESKKQEKGLMVEDSDEQMKCFDKASSSVGRRKYTREEKAKGVQVENLSSSPEIARVGVQEIDIENAINNHEPPHAFGIELPEMVNAEQTQSHDNNNIDDGIGNATRNQLFRDIAKKNASKFAHFDAEMEEEEDLSDKEVEQQAQDWPGPFSTAMKIIKDREENSFLDEDTHVPYKEKSSLIIWAPSRRDHTFDPPSAPSLLELSLRVLVKNADAITSLDYVPDSLRIQICQLLCDSRRMNVHFLHLLVRGSPTAICVPDCSWLTEEQFTECFTNCDTSNLMVLQLDQCGRCIPDYVIPLTLARSQKNLPLLSSLSLNGACRLSDVGLRALVSAAPGIRSINLNQCSLLTSASIDMLSDSLGSVLRELYINECQNIDMKLIVPALKKFENLEVLSLVDLPSVRGRLLREIVTARGQSLKQLVLTNSVKLTDSCVKAISENCPNLSVLDLSNVCKLTDSALGYLANGCQGLEKLIFCRNSFSDEAVAAFVETSGGSLKELSLNKVKKVGQNTALALGKYSEKLEILDVSWCRDISDVSLGYIVDNCMSLKVLKLFGCTHITDKFVGGHSNPNVKILGLKMDPFLDHLTKREPCCS